MAQELLEQDDKNEKTIWYMVKICHDLGDFYGEKLYLEYYVEISKINNIKAKMRLDKVNETIKQEEKEKKFHKHKFMEEIQKDFLEGTLTLENIGPMIKQAQKYPDYIQSLSFILEIKAMMTGNLQDKIEGLKNYLIVSEQDLSQEQKSMLIDEIEQTEERRQQEKLIEKETAYQYSNEQRQYSKQIITKLKSGEILSENIPEIVTRLESFPDKARAIFLITKLYETVYGKNEAYQSLIKYSKTKSLNPQEKHLVAQMQRKLLTPEKPKISHKVENIRKPKVDTAKKYTEEIPRQEIIDLLEKGKSVFEIFKILEGKVSKKRIAKIRGFYMREESQMAKQLEMEGYAKEFLEEGYSIRDVYDVLEGDVPMTTLREISHKIKEEDERNIE